MESRAILDGIILEKPELAYRILDSQFIKICSDVTHWMYLEPPKSILQFK